MLKKAHIALFLALCACTSAPKEPTLFEEVSEAAGIDFANVLEENDQQNIVDYLYFYNGAGVAVADFDGNGFEDIYFVRNQGANALYFNQGNWKFTKGDRSAAGSADFQTGVSVVDINADGFPDLHVSAVNYHIWNGHNEFYLNQGDGTFTEISQDLGIDLAGYGQQALFFDCDNDGDQDLYVLRHSVHPSGAYNKASQRGTTDEKAGDRFFLNTGSPEAPVFEDKTEEYGVLSSQLGYGLAIVAEDFNSDGYLDVFVANDFHENDYLYLNRAGEGFELATDESFQTNSKFTMGVDAGDLNGDGLTDLFTLDMKPWDEVERKNALGAEPFHIHKYKRSQGYVEQFPKNSAHLQRGSVASKGMALPVFEDVAPLLGVESTDWSWGVLLEDFDGDGYKDLYVTNGIKRRPNDLDYIQFLSSGEGVAKSDESIYSQMPPGLVSNRAYRGTRDGMVETSKSWGLDFKGTSNGSAVADFDNDGKLDLVINNLDDRAHLYRNILATAATTVDFGGYNVRYRKRLGAKSHWNLGTRSWLSHSSTRKNVDDFGGGIIVEWPNGTAEAYTLLPGEHNALRPGEGMAVDGLETVNKSRVAAALDTLPFGHKEDAYTSFVETPLLIQGTDELGPAGAYFDGKLFVGASTGKAPLWADLQTMDTTLLWADKAHEDVDAALVTLGTGQTALVVVTGSSQMPNNSARQQDRIYFHSDKPSVSLGEEGTNASCVAVLDLNGDGNDDIFIGERSIWNDYGAAPSHAVYYGTNDGWFEKGQPSWTAELGMITDAIAGDLDGDGTNELIVAEDWGKIKSVDSNGKVQSLSENGWWRSVYVADLDHDGTAEIFAGGVGQNHGIALSPETPVELWITDLDGNGNRDFLYSYVNQGERYPLFGRDELIKESVKYRKDYLKNRTFSGVPFEKMFGDALADVEPLSVGFTGSALLVSSDSGWVQLALPSDAQQAPINAAIATERGLLLCGGADNMHTSIGTQESFCGTFLTYGSSGPLCSDAPFILRGSTAKLVSTPHGLVLLQNDGAALLYTGDL